MQAKTATLPADQLLLDLEDATAASEKAAARGTVVESLKRISFANKIISVRVNGVGTPWCYRDLVDVVEAAGDRVDTVYLPKAESAADVQFVDRLLSQIELA
ncbi:MAG TPA: aldolase/citrate lyase family protein, partial [Chloroflexota bacterium]|nr:aldolase/citrate lyase family protein [Chloroflexota bacterium]